MKPGSVQSQKISVVRIVKARIVKAEKAFLSVVVLHFGKRFPKPCKMNKCFEAGVWGAEPRKANSGHRARAGGSS